MNNNRKNEHLMTILDGYEHALQAVQAEALSTTWEYGAITRNYPYGYLIVFRRYTPGSVIVAAIKLLLSYPHIHICEIAMDEIKARLCLVIFREAEILLESQVPGTQCSYCVDRPSRVTSMNHIGSIEMAASAICKAWRRQYNR